MALPAPDVAGPLTTKKRRWPLWVGLGAAVAIAGLFALGYSAMRQAAPQPVAREVWEQWGMRIEHPAGLQEQYQGVFENVATERSGVVSWLWNNGGTSLSVSWGSGPAVDYEAGFKQTELALASRGSNVTRVAEGVATLDGRDWPYRTFSFELDRKTYYATIALGFYQEKNRLYGLVFSDADPNTLDLLLEYAASFRG